MLVESLSGATYIILYFSSFISLTLSRSSLLATELFIKVEGIPISFSESTWSFISEISGEITMVRPLSNTAGN